MDGLIRNQTPIDPALLRVALKRYPTIQKAISAVIHLGKQHGSLDITQREPGWTLIHALGSLVYAMRCPGSQTASDAVDMIKAHWELYVAPWVGALLRVMTFDESRTQNAAEIIEHALVAIPQLITCNARSTAGQPAGEFNRMHAQALYLRPLLIRIWFNLLHERHRETRNWTISLSYYNTGLYVEFQDWSSDPSRALSYLDNSLTEHRAGIILITHLNELRKTIRTFDLDGFQQLGKFLSLVAASGPLAPHAPFYMRSVARRMVSALVKLLRLLPFKWRNLPPLQSPHFEWVHRTVALIVGHLAEGMALGRLWVEEALDAGLIPAILKANPIYSIYEEVVGSGIGAEQTIVRLLGNLTLYIYPYLLWPSMTRRVLRWSKKIQSSRSEDITRDKSQARRTDWWASWEGIEDQARTFHSVMAELKARQCICSNVQ
ncbi:hypothetical protein V5O48_013336, partial [Marasmius crinis-equi]